MATLAPEEQEQLDDLKRFWQRHGNLVSGVLLLLVAAYAAWAGWGWWQRGQAVKASVLFDAFEAAAEAGDADKTLRGFTDLRERFPRTVFAQQAGLYAAKVSFEKGKPDDARGALTWVAEHADEPGYRSIARLRLAGILLDQKQYDPALKQLDGVDDGGFKALADDRRGDVFLAQGKLDAARVAYQRAYGTMDAQVQYRHVIDAKLNALGVAAPAASATVGGARP